MLTRYFEAFEREQPYRAHRGGRAVDRLLVLALFLVLLVAARLAFPGGLG